MTKGVDIVSLIANTGASSAMSTSGMLMQLGGGVAMVMATETKYGQTLLSVERLEADLIDGLHIFLSYVQS